MMAISSHRPFSSCEEFSKNQTNAFDSWYPIFSKIVYFGDIEPRLQSEKTLFLKSDPFPKIIDMASFASLARVDYITLINSDIVLKPDMRTVFKIMTDKRLDAAISRRYQFDSVSPGKLVDFGLDIFVARPSVWAKVIANIPPELRIGHNNWDTWLAGFFNKTLKNKVADFTQRKIVFHPFHGSRKRPHESEVNINDKYLHCAALPGTKI